MTTWNIASVTNCLRSCVGKSHYPLRHSDLAPPHCTPQSVLTLYISSKRDPFVGLPALFPCSTNFSTLSTRESQSVTFLFLPTVVGYHQTPLEWLLYLLHINIDVIIFPLCGSSLFLISSETVSLFFSAPVQLHYAS